MTAPTVRKWYMHAVNFDSCRETIERCGGCGGGCTSLFENLPSSSQPTEQDEHDKPTLRSKPCEPVAGELAPPHKPLLPKRQLVASRAEEGSAVSAGFCVFNV